MASEDRGINVLTLLEIGSDELQWLQGDLGDRERFARQVLTATPGWFGAQRAGPNGASRYGWTITEQGTSGELRLESIYATGNPVGLGPKAGNAIVPPRLGGVMPNGQCVDIKIGDHFSLDDENGDPVVVPDDATWHTLVAFYVTEVFEPGVLNLVQNNTTVTGIWTDFTRYSDSSAPVPTIIRIDAADSVNGNEGEYLVDTITDPTTMTLTPAPPGADETVRYRVKGRFFAAPAGEVDAHRNGRLAWELRPRVSSIPADALIAYDVYRDTGSSANVFLVDRRGANTFRQLPQKGDATSTRLVPTFLKIYTSPLSPTSAPEFERVEVNLGSAAVLETDLAPCSVQRLTGASADANGLLFLWVESDGIHGKRAQTAITAGTGLFVTFGSPPLLGWNFEAKALKIAQASITGMSVEQMQSGKGSWTHMVAYSTGGKVRVARSADNGNNWSTSGVVWNPANVNGSHTAHSPALLWTNTGRMILAAVYDNGGGGKTIRGITSDDYGDTWSTNGDAGVTFCSGTNNPRDLELVQDGFGNIVGFFVEDASNDEIWSWIGTNNISAIIDNDKATTADKGTKMHDSANVPLLGPVVGQPRAIAFQDGTVACAFATVTASGIGLNNLLHVRENEILKLNIEVGIDGVGEYAGPTNPVCALEASNTGDAFLVVVDTDATANGDLYAQRYQCVQVDTGASWPGGR